MTSASNDLRRKVHTKSVDGWKETPDDRAANDLNFYANQRQAAPKCL